MKSDIMLFGQTVKTVDNSENNTKAIDSWVKSIADLHRTQPAPTVHYSKYVTCNSNIKPSNVGQMSHTLYTGTLFSVLGSTSNASMKYIFKILVHICILYRKCILYS